MVTCRKLAAIFTAGSLLLAAAAGCSAKPGGVSGTASSSAPAAVASSAPAAAASSAPVGSSPPAQTVQQTAILCDNAFTLYSAQNYAAAIAECDQAIKIDPACYQAYNLKGVSLCFEGDYGSGMPLIQKSVLIKPDYAYGYFNLAIGSKLQKDYANAILWFNKSLTLNPGDAWCYYGIATIYADTGNTEQAFDYLKQAVALNSSVKAVAKQQDHFASYRDNAEFKQIVG